MRGGKKLKILYYQVMLYEMSSSVYQQRWNIVVKIIQVRNI